MKVFGFVLLALRWIVNKVDFLIFGRSYPNYVSANSILNIPFYTAIATGLLFVILSFAGHHSLPLGYTVMSFQACACCIAVATHYKYFFNMPTITLKISYFIFLTVLSLVSGYIFALMFVYLFAIMMIILVVLFFLWCMCSRYYVRRGNTFYEV